MHHEKYMYRENVCMPNSHLVNSFSGNIQAWKNKGQIPVIAEIKSYSTDHGDLLRGRSIKDIVAAYIDGGAACLSVVTGKWFKGHSGMLIEIAQYTNYPILRKDFIINKQQILESKDYGASAVLLTHALLKREHLLALAEFAVSIDLVPFVEVASLNEIDGLLLPNGSIIAINNKDIQQREKGEADLQKSLSLVTSCRDTQAHFIASASGIESHEHVRVLWEKGFDAFLIGTSLLLCDDVRSKLAQIVSIR